jgi:hypothetical protein
MRMWCWLVMDMAAGSTSFSEEEDIEGEPVLEIGGVSGVEYGTGVDCSRADIMFAVWCNIKRKRPMSVLVLLECLRRTHEHKGSGRVVYYIGLVVGCNQDWCNWMVSNNKGQIAGAQCI